MGAKTLRALRLTLGCGESLRGRAVFKSPLPPKAPRHTPGKQDEPPSGAGSR